MSTNRFNRWGQWVEIGEQSHYVLNGVTLCGCKGKHKGPSGIYNTRSGVTFTKPVCMACADENSLRWYRVETGFQ